MEPLNELIKALCCLNAPSGSEQPAADYILQKIAPYCTAEKDLNGNIIAFKNGKKRPKNRVMLDAHLDEVGVIITAVTESGFALFEPLGGILPETLVCKRVLVNGHLGVIGAKPIHLASAEERKNPFTQKDLTIDFGAANRAEALTLVQPGDCGTFESEFTPLEGNFVKAKALDDRVGCALLMQLLSQPAEYDYYATFTVQEELGCRGAKTAAFTVQPNIALVLEATTANDIADTPPEKAVCFAGGGAVVSFMDRATLYDRELFELALATAAEQKIAVQTKNAVAGGNNAGAISLSGAGVRTLALSLPCRYIHSPSGVASFEDCKALQALAAALLPKLCSL